MHELADHGVRLCQVIRKFTASMVYSVFMYIYF